MYYSISFISYRSNNIEHTAFYTFPDPPHLCPSIMFPCQSPQIWSTEDSERLSKKLWELRGKICWTCRICFPCESMWYHGPFYWKHCPSLILQEASCSLLSASVESSISASESLAVWTSHSKRWWPMMTDDDHDDRQCWSKSGDLICCSPCAVLEPLIPGR